VDPEACRLLPKSPDFLFFVLESEQPWNGQSPSFLHLVGRETAKPEGNGSSGSGTYPCSR
jgi:hypothetical protein